MKKNIGTCYVGRHVNGDRFVILKFALDKNLGIHFLTGPIVSISSQEMESKGLFIVLDQLQNIQTIDSENLIDKEKIPDKELLKLKQNYVLISVELLKSNVEEMKIIPLHAGKGWRFDCHVEEIQLFPLPLSNYKFMQHLNNALELAN